MDSGPRRCRGSPATKDLMSLGRLGLHAALGPIIGRLFRARKRLSGLKARRHRCIGAGEDLVVLDAERAQPALLPHGQGDEIADLDELGLAEMPVQPRPELVIDRQIPGDRLGIGERRLLPLVIAARALEIEEIAVVVLDHALLCRLDRALIAAEFAQHRTRHVNAAEFLDRVIGDAVFEHVTPGIGERPEYGRHMGTDRLAFRPRCAFARAAIELSAHGLIRHLGGIDIADPWLRHRCFLRFLLRLIDKADTLYSPCSTGLLTWCRKATVRSTALVRLTSVLSLEANESAATSERFLTIRR